MRVLSLDHGGLAVDSRRVEGREWGCCLEADVLQQAEDCSRWREEEIGVILAARGVRRKAVVLLAVKYARERSVGNDWGSLAVRVTETLILMLVGRCGMLIFWPLSLARLFDASALLALRLDGKVCYTLVCKGLLSTRGTTQYCCSDASLQIQQKAEATVSMTQRSSHTCGGIIYRGWQYF